MREKLTNNKFKTKKVQILVKGNWFDRVLGIEPKSMRFEVVRLVD